MKKKNKGLHKSVSKTKSSAKISKQGSVGFGGISRVSSLTLAQLAPLKVFAYTGCSTCSGRGIQMCC